MRACQLLARHGFFMRRLSSLPTCVPIDSATQQGSASDEPTDSEDISLQYLQPTYCQRAPIESNSSRAEEVSLSDRRFRLRLPTHTLVRASRRHLPRGLWLTRRCHQTRVVARLEPRAPAVTITKRTPPGGPPPDGACCTNTVLCRHQCWPHGLITDATCRAARLPPAFRRRC